MYIHTVYNVYVRESKTAQYILQNKLSEAIKIFFTLSSVRYTE